MFMNQPGALFPLPCSPSASRAPVLGREVSSQGVGSPVTPQGGLPGAPLAEWGLLTGVSDGSRDEVWTPGVQAVPVAGKALHGGVLGPLRAFLPHPPPWVPLRASCRGLKVKFCSTGVTSRTLNSTPPFLSRAKPREAAPGTPAARGSWSGCRSPAQGRVTGCLAHARPLGHTSFSSLEQLTRCPRGSVSFLCVVEDNYTLCLQVQS